MSRSTLVLAALACFATVAQADSTRPYSESPLAKATSFTVEVTNAKLINKMLAGKEQLFIQNGKVAGEQDLKSTVPNCLMATLDGSAYSVSTGDRLVFAPLQMSDNNMIMGRTADERLAVVCGRELTMDNMSGLTADEVQAAFGATARATFAF
jgi:hypothetical protein